MIIFFSGCSFSQIRTRTVPGRSIKSPGSNHEQHRRRLRSIRKWSLSLRLPIPMHPLPSIPTKQLARPLRSKLSRTPHTTLQSRRRQRLQFFQRWWRIRMPEEKSLPGKEKKQEYIKKREGEYIFYFFLDYLPCSVSWWRTVRKNLRGLTEDK